MKVFVVKDALEGASRAADEVEKVIRAKSGCTLGLATGSSPIPLYQELARRCRENGLDFSGVHSVNLDEYVGLDGTHPQSYRFFMDKNLFDQINIDKANTFVVSGVGNVRENLQEFNRKLADTEIDIQVLGVGPDGHLGFNEPGEELWDGAHEEKLDESTIEANKRFFASRDEVPTRALTMGMGNIMRAARLLILIGGNKKEAASKLLLNDKIDPHWPCTFAKLHRDATVIIEKQLADEIGYTQ